MADNAFLDTVGLSMTTLFPSQGVTCTDNFEQIIAALSPSSSHSTETRAAIADGISLWCSCAPFETKQRALKQHKEKLYDVLYELAIHTQDDTDKSQDYKGAVYVAAKIASGMMTSCQMDQTFALVQDLSPLGYNLAEKYLAVARTFGVKTPMMGRDTPETYSTDFIGSLIQCLPYTGTINIPNGLKVISKILLQKDPVAPESVKTQAKSALQILMMVAKESVVKSGGELVALAKIPGNEGLLMHFVTTPDLYKFSPDAVHDNIDLFMKQAYSSYASLFMNVSQTNVSVLVPYADTFINNIPAFSMFGTLTLIIISNIAAYDPDAIYPTIEKLATTGRVTGGDAMLAKAIAACAGAKVSKAGDHVLKLLVDLLESAASKDATSIPGIMTIISNILQQLSGKEVMTDYMPRLSKFKNAAEVAFAAMDDFASGRSLETLTKRVDEIDARINAMNKKIAETCTNMADVIAYVDANMADMKDFLADVVKKLPNPKRLEVVGTLRKTLILHFECVRTGYEFPIVSHEWSKWLKMGFSLVKAGQAVIDLGMGNPLGILKKGVECVQEIYSAYKTNDDDEFNTYITNPFLTSTEQDQLLEKLRDQGFFEIFAYDAQLGGWYLLHPEKDGKPPAGDAGSVSKVWKKEGYGVTESVIAGVKDFISEDIGAGLETALGVATAASEVLSPMLKSGDDQSKETVPTNASTTGSAKSGSTHVLGGRAAAMREQFGSAAITADDKLQQASQTAVYNKKVDDLSADVKRLEEKVNALSASLEQVRNQKQGCCTIC